MKFICSECAFNQITTLGLEREKSGPLCIQCIKKLLATTTAALWKAGTTNQLPFLGK